MHWDTRMPSSAVIVHDRLKLLVCPVFTHAEGVCLKLGVNCLLHMQLTPRPEIPSIDGEDLAAKLHKVRFLACLPLQQHSSLP